MMRPGRGWEMDGGGGYRLGWVAALNFCVNALLLAGTAQLAGRWVPPLRLLLASALGAVYAAGCLAPDFGFLGGLHWRLVSLALMSVLAFGAEIRLGCVFAVLTMALGGVALAADSGAVWLLPLYAAGVFLLGKFAFGCPGRRLLPVEISGNGKRVRLVALLDTGNQLRDPITGEPVLVIDCQQAFRLTGLGLEQLKHPLDTMTAPPLPGLRLIPYRAVGAENGLLLAMRFPKISMGGRTRPGIVAFAPQRLGEDYQALGNL